MLRKRTPAHHTTSALQRESAITRLLILISLVKRSMSAAGVKSTRNRVGDTRHGSAKTRTTDSLVRNSNWALLFLAGHPSP